MTLHSDLSAVLRSTVALSIAFCLGGSAEAQETRTWHHEQWEAKAVLVSQDVKNCILPGTNGKERQFSKAAFSSEDRDYLRAEKTRQLVAEDLEQWSLVSQVIPDLTEKPELAFDQLKAYHKNYPESPYAGLMAGVARCMAKNDFGTARVLFRDVQKRIENQRHYRYEAHPLTLSSSLNNEAICEIKALRGGAAAARLIHAAKLSETPMPAVIHNGRTLARVAAGDGAMIDLPNLSRKKLLEAVTSSPGTQVDLEDGYYFSCAVDMPAKPNSTASTEEVTDMALRDHWCIACEGSGRIKCRVRGCGNGVISVSVRAIIGKGINGPIYGNVKKQERCAGCRGRGAWPCTQCKDGRI